MSCMSPTLLFLALPFLHLFFCYVRVKALISAFRTLCIALPYFPTKLPSQDSSVPIHLPATNACCHTPDFFHGDPELPGVEYFTFII